MTETNFFQSWAFWFLVGIVVGFVAGFILAIILAASSKASRMEEELDKEILAFKSKDVQPYKDFNDAKDTHMTITRVMGKVKNHFRKPEDA